MQVSEFEGLREALEASGKEDPLRDESPVLRFLEPMAHNERIRVVERPFTTKFNGNFSKQSIVCVVTSHRVCVCSWKGGLRGQRIVEQLHLPLPQCRGFETYERPFGTGDLVFGLEARTSAGWVDMYSTLRWSATGWRNASTRESPCVRGRAESQSVA
jgi:hypothetical protein